MRNLAFRVPDEMYEFLKDKNISRYIRTLIWEDMEGKRNTQCCEELLKIKEQLKIIIKEA